MKKISAIIIAKNEEEMIKDCLNSVRFCDEIILVDNNSSDNTVSIAKKFSAKIVYASSNDYSHLRNIGLKNTRYSWVLYVDADERVSKGLANEIVDVISQKRDIAGYKIKRKNYYLGKYAWPYIEYLERLFFKNCLDRWQGVLHETPIVNGEMGQLENFLLHFTHRDLSLMVEKTNKWSDAEALLRFNAHHPEMTWWRFPRVMLQAFYDSYIKQGGWKIGTPGFIESIYQAFSIFITYAKLWEMQRVGANITRNNEKNI